LLSTQSVEQFLHEMAVMAARLVGGGLSCGMTMQPSGRPVTVACSDQVAARVDEVQYELDDGRACTPCATARGAHRGHHGEGALARVRGPGGSHGIRSCLALPLNADGKPVGALNLYSRQASAFGTAEARRAENFAENASGALSLAMSWPRTPRSSSSCVHRLRRER
jgi:Transcriptional regulator containing GAF, AAA-type ATPase, and DNA binding domains